MGRSKRRGRPRAARAVAARALATRALMAALVIGMLPVLVAIAVIVAAVAAAPRRVGLGPFVTVGPTLAEPVPIPVTSVALAVGAAVGLVLAAFAVRAVAWRRIRRVLRAALADADQLGALAARCVDQVTPAEGGARTLAGQLDDLSAAITGIVTALREMGAWARWLLPRWEALTVQRRVDGAAHLLEQLRRTRDALDAQARGAEALATAAGRVPVGGLDPAAEDAALVASARRLREDIFAIIRALGVVGAGGAPGAKSMDTPDADGEEAGAPVRWGVLYLRTVTMMLAAHVVPLALAGVAWIAGGGVGPADGPWSYAVVVGAVIAVDLVVAAWLARSAGRALRPLGRTLERGAGQLRAVEEAEHALPADGPRMVATVQASARTVRRGTAVAGGALEWPIRMGRPLFEATAFDDAAGRHLVDVAAHQVDEAARVVAVLDQQIAFMRGEATELVARTAAAVRDGTRSEECADAVADAAQTLLAAVVGGRDVERALTAGSQRQGEDARTVTNAGSADQDEAARARLGASLSWRQRISHVMPRIRPRIRPARSGDRQPATHGVPAKPRLATYRPVEPQRERVTVAEDPTVARPLPGVYRVATEAELRRFGADAGGQDGGGALEDDTVIDAVEVWELGGAER